MSSNESTGGADDAATGGLGDYMKTTTTQIKGTDPENVRQLCLRMCRQFVGGIWSTTSVQSVDNNILVKRLTGGLTNKIYLCQLLANNDDLADDTDCPTKLVIRLNAKRFCIGHHQDVHKDYIMAPLLGQLGLGPKIYGICPEGQVLQYYPHRHFTENDMTDKQLVGKLAKMLAQFHQLDAPISKHSDWILDFCTDGLAKLVDRESELIEKFNEYNCLNFQSIDLKLEMNWLIESLETYMSSHTTGVDTDTDTDTTTADRFVLTHADFRCGNIWVTNDSTGSLLLSDFDHSSYGSRGLDLGLLFSEFVRKSPIDFPDDQLMRRFIADYIGESGRLCDGDVGDGNDDQKWSKRSVNSVDSVLNECKFFIIAYHLIVMFIIIMSDNEVPLDEKTSYAICDASIGIYIELKRKFIAHKK
ncbi:choline/ethanolamine kinase-like [Oppia nitens]|uniref:choline/ethanolamine kinase-like n=1 Tax=Oppia nitens TaxID=1686743 RepID=UPI0023DB3805|nr:choline/ethanolamine kinase-like [Oppia nitens]